MYGAAYWLHPARPGTSAEHPWGWFGWFDQGKYLRAALALSQFSFSPELYFYPPLYPALGALFLKLTPLHSFFFVDAICFLLYAHFFIDLARRYVGWWPAVIVFSLSFIPVREFMGLWIEPWTTTLVAPIYAYLFWSVNRLSNTCELPSYRWCALSGALGAAVLATRPADAVAIAPLFIYLMIWLYRSALLAGNARHSFICGLVVCAAGLAGICGYFAFNYSVYGGVLGNYFDISTNRNGFHFYDLPEKAVSIFLDAQPLYGPDGESVLLKMPWLSALLPGFIYMLIFGSTVFRLLGVVVLTQLLIYLPYSDLLPTGMWKYHNIHYFKWMFPYLWLLGLFSLLQAKNELCNRRAVGILRYAVCAMLAVILLSIQVRLIDITDLVEISKTGEAELVSIQIESRQPLVIDLIKMPDVVGGYREIYFGFENSVESSGIPLVPIRDFRLFPLNPGAQLLFIRPLRLERINVMPKELTIQGDASSIKCYRYSFALGWPAWLTLPARFGHIKLSGA